ncbi:isochorismate synthase 2, chloroplastic-like [Iris pallida]|uniref:Isochorismate synthase 2, chloroplastic-like n=1 Tax=Iris pallida TaxID=29817 RepID=A0AAX6FCB6_IRIPA|nr:isochorismate synthase 2, chloroplastic-like [Iris pallida]
MAAHSATGSSRSTCLSKVSSLRRRYKPCSVSMNGCGSGSDKAVGIRETRTLPSVSAPQAAVLELKSAISTLSADPPRVDSGIIRLEVPIRQRAGAIDWLHAQQLHLPRCYFSGRDRQSFSDLVAIPGNGNSSKNGGNLVSVAGVGSAVFFRRSDPFSMEDWRCIKRFLSKETPLIRAYGAIRFDAKSNISPEWRDFGSFYFIVPQVEFDELEESSLLATTIAWDNTLHWTWEKAMQGLHATIHQISSSFDKLRKSVPRTAIVGCSHVPTKISWDISVRKALQIINKANSDIVKVVLARCSKLVTDSAVDPVTLLACLQADGRAKCLPVLYSAT